MVKRQRRPRRAATIAAVLAVASLTLASCAPVETRIIVGAVTRGALSGAGERCDRKGVRCEVAGTLCASPGVGLVWKI